MNQARGVPWIYPGTPVFNVENDYVTTEGIIADIVFPTIDKKIAKEGLLRDSAKNGDEYWSSREMSTLESE